MTTPGVFVHATGGADNQVHLAITIPPTLLINEFIGQLKGAVIGAEGGFGANRDAVRQRHVAIRGAGREPVHGDRSHGAAPPLDDGRRPAEGPDAHGAVRR